MGATRPQRLTFGSGRVHVVLLKHIMSLVLELKFTVAGKRKEIANAARSYLPWEDLGGPT